VKLWKRKNSKIYIDVYINGRWKVTYTLCAEKLSTLGPGWIDDATACGDGAHMRIDIPVVVN